MSKYLDSVQAFYINRFECKKHHTFQKLYNYKVWQYDEEI